MRLILSEALASEKKINLWLFFVSTREKQNSEKQITKLILHRSGLLIKTTLVKLVLLDDYCVHGIEATYLTQSANIDENQAFFNWQIFG